MMNTNRRGSVYLAVIGVVSAVTILTLTGVALRKELHERAAVGIDSANVHRMAQSGAEVGVHIALTRPTTFLARAKAGPVMLTDNAFNGGEFSLAVTDADTGSTATATTSRFSMVSEATLDEARSRLGLEIQYQDDDLRLLVQSYGAVAYWPLDETSGTTAHEVIADRDGTYSKAGAVGKLTHKHTNPAPRNYWVDEYTSVPHSSQFEINSGTIVFWAKWDIMPSLIDGGVISKEGNSVGTDAHFAVYLDTSGKLTAMLRERSGDEDGGSTGANGVITAGTWHHIAVSWGPSLDLWVDGARVASNGSVNIGLKSSSEVSANTRPWYFGVRKRSYLMYDPAYHAYGSVARVALFKDNLTAQQIQNLMAANSMRDKFEVVPGSYARVVD